MSEVENVSNTVQGALSEEDKEKLSKALFPTTDPEHIKVLGVERTLYALPYKVAKQVRASVKPAWEGINKRIQEEQEGNAGVDSGTDEQLAEALFRAASVIAKHYDWDDVVKALATEDVSIPEVQTIITGQLEVQGRSDFMLNPLQMLCEMQRVSEISLLQWGNMSIGLPSVTLGQ